MDPVTLAAQALTWSVNTPDETLEAVLLSVPAWDKEQVLELAEEVIFYGPHNADTYTYLTKCCDMRARLDLVPYVWAQYLYIAKEEL